MSMSYKLETKGLQALVKKLDPAILGPAVIQAFKEAGEVAKPEIVRRAPRDTRGGTSTPIRYQERR